MNARRILVSASVAIFAALQLVAGPAQAQSVKEFSAGITQAPSPRGIVLGPDGNIWFSEQTGNRIGRITPAGVVTEFSAGLSPGANPGGMAFGPDNNIWFVERNGNRIGRIIAIPANGTVGTITEFSAGISPGAFPVSIAAGSDGNLWFTENTGNRIGRITTSGVVTEFSAGISAGAFPNNIVAGPDGNLWFTEQGDRIARITTAGVVTEFSAGLTAGGAPNGLAVGPDNNLWFTEINGNRVGKITTAGVVTEYSAGITAGSSPRNIVAGPDGNLWFTETTGNRIGRVTTAGVVTEFSAGITAAAQPWSIATGSDGNLWFTEFAAGQIGRITTAGVVLAEFTAGITPGSFPFWIAPGPDGNLWFTEPGINAVGRITPLGAVTEFRTGITPGSAPLLITAGPDGNLWFTEYDGNRIGRITTTGVVTEFSAGITAGASPAGITVGPDNNIWFTENTGDRIGRIIALPANGTVGTVTEFSAGITAGAEVNDIKAGPDGNLWFTEGTGNRIGRITPAGVVTEFSAGITGGSSPLGITLGPDNNMWFTESNAARIGKIIALPANGVVGTVTEFPSFGGANEFIAAGSDGNLWYTKNSANRIGRITPLGVVTEISAGLSPGAGLEGIAAGPDGNLWFAESNINRVARITTTSDFVVTNNNDSGAGSLRDAVAQANVAVAFSTPTIAFAPAVTGTILLTSGKIQLNRAMTITGPGAATLTIDGNAFDRIFVISEAGSPACPALSGPTDFLVTISGLTLQNGVVNNDNSGAAIFSAHSLALDSVVIKNNIAPRGGGVSLAAQYAGQALTVTNSQFQGNVAKPTALGTVIADIGGGLLIAERCGGTSTVTSTTIANSVFSGNSSQPTAQFGLGGAIGAVTRGTVTITDTRIVNNSVVAPNPPAANQVYIGGGIFAQSTNSFSIIRSEISGNSAVDVTNADVTRGGGIGALNNLSTLQGAANVMNLSIVDSTISGNTDSALVGGMVVFGNVAATIDNSTIAGNTAALSGAGGIFLTTGATSPPSASNATAPTLAMASSIAAGNSMDIATNVATMPTFTLNADHSLIGTLCPSPTCVITVVGSGNLMGANPMLGPLAFNGGPTQTHALLIGSPAINAGSNPLALTTDQRGGIFARVVGPAADMGAYEFNPVAAPVLQSAASRKVHGSAGTFNLPLTLLPLTNPTTEPRQGPAHTIVFTFDSPIVSATAAITAGTATAALPTFSGNDVIVALTGVINQQYVTVALTNVASAGGGTGGSGTVRVGFLTGDVNQNRVVAVSDLGLVNAQLAQTVTAANYLKDINATGTLTVADKGITNANLAKALPPP